MAEGVVRDSQVLTFYLPCPHCRTLRAQPETECHSCGLIFAKWRARGIPESEVFVAAFKPALRTRIYGWLRMAAAAGLGVFLIWGWGRSLEIGAADFGPRVLQAPTPVLVMFNVAPFCGCAEDELRELRGEWKGRIAVVTLNAIASPALGAEYGVDKDPMLLLFDKGRLVKAANAREMEERVEARHGGSYDSADMKAELEAFVRPS